MIKSALPLTRSQIMGRVKNSNTKPEKKVRSVLHKLGFRFRVNRRDLPGSPDIVLPKYRTVIFVHGCFWHQHPGCRKAKRPKTRVAFWNAKLDRNIERDRENQGALESSRWRVLVIWECQTIQENSLIRLLQGFFVPK